MPITRYLKSMVSQPTPAGATEEPKVSFVHSGNFPELLARAGVALAVTTYQAGKLCFISSYQGRLRLLMRTYDRAMGLWVYPEGLLLATRNQVWNFVKAPHLLPIYYADRDYDTLYLPQMAYVTGDVAIHDLFLLSDQITFVNTRFSCVARTDSKRSFVPLWWPKFISRLVPEDRCHLNGVALANNQVRYAVALGATDYAAGWRDGKATEGCVIDGPTREVIFKGLAMPHSPRLQGRRLWLLNSGCGELGYLDRETWQPIAQMPGFLRGLALTKNYAFVGLSKAREEATFGGMPIGERKLQCGVQVVNLMTGVVEAWLEFQSGIEEIYDVQLMPKCKHPFVLGFQKEDINQIFNLDPL